MADQKQPIFLHKRNLQPSRDAPQVYYAQLSNVRIAYETFGKADNPAVILIMGLGAQMLVWPDALCEALASQRLYVVRFDNRDIGLSSRVSSCLPNLTISLLRKKVGLRPNAPYDLVDMATDTSELLSHLSIKQAHIAGASMGGMIAQVFAAKFPERTLSLTVFMTSSGVTTFPVFNPKLALSLIRKPNLDSPGSLLQHKLRLIRAIGSRSYPTPESEIIARVKRVLERSLDDSTGIRRQTAALMATGSLQLLQQVIHCPTLVIHGDEDQLIRPELGRQVAQNIAAARFELIEGMGHDFPRPLHARLGRLMSEHIIRHQNVLSLASFRPLSS